MHVCGHFSLYLWNFPLGELPYAYHGALLSRRLHVFAVLKRSPYITLLVLPVFVRGAGVITRVFAYKYSHTFKCSWTFLVFNMISKDMDLLKTISDNEDVEDYSEDSDVEVEFQPKKRREKQEDFSTSFEFTIEGLDSFPKNTNYVQKYVRGTGKSRVDDKINKFLGERKKKRKKDAETELVANSDEDDSELSEDELKPDDVKQRNSSVKAMKKNFGECEDSSFFEEAPPFDESSTFFEMNLSRPLMKAIAAMNFVHPTPIQAATIPVALLGRDVCGCAATGTGKTAAYMLPILERLLYRPTKLTACTIVLVLVPTRELGVQVYEVSKRLAEFTSVTIGLAVGGLDLKPQETVLRTNPDIVIATPGRLIDHIKNTPSFSLDSIEVLVLDEADRILDEYFAAQLGEIVDQCSRTRQTLLFSATMTTEVKALAAVSLKKPVKIFVDSNQVVASNLQQEFVRIRTENEGAREPVLAALVCRTFRDHALIFVPTKKEAHRMHIMLGLLGVKAGELHGDMTQLQRLEALRRFKEEELDVLIATDVAARGLDIVGVKTVINYTMPRTREHYIHRVGRTARAGRSGISVSLVGETEYKVVKDIIKNASRPPKSRTIPQDIIAKYRVKIQEIQPELNAIIKEEMVERNLLKMEKQLNIAEKALKNEEDPDGRKRKWFQTQKQRLEEKKRLQFSKYSQEDVTKPKEEVAEKKKKKKKKDKKTAEADAISSLQNERDIRLMKIRDLQCRRAKKINRPKPITSMGSNLQKVAQPEGKEDPFQKNGRKTKNQRKNALELALTDTSSESVRRWRSESNVHNRPDDFDSAKINYSRLASKTSKRRRYKKNA